MIRTRSDLHFYLEADRHALGRTRVRPKLAGDDIWKFQRALRRYEYALNSGRSLLGMVALLWWRFRYYHYSIRCNFELPPNVAGPGLSLAHRGPIIVNPASRIGANCRIHSCVNIGTSAGTQSEAPQIGDDVYIGPGAKLFGPIRIADRIAVAAQAVVNRSFETPDITIGGIPARVLSDTGSREFIIDGASIARNILS